MLNIRIHGRGGQGVVTAAELIALAAFKAGQFAQAFPVFGVERTGAPIQSFVRLSDAPILTREQIYEPEILIIQDATLLDNPEVFAGTKKNTLVIINSPLSASEAYKQIKKGNPRAAVKADQVFTSPATEIALRIIGKNIINTVLLGAFARYTKIVSLGALKAAIEEKFQGKGQEIINKNIKAALEAFSR